MRTEVHDITAEQAREFLAKNLAFERGKSGTNRPVSLRTVNNYACAMLRGEWRLTHQGIAFDRKGNLKDGQHRLLAIVQAAEEGAREGNIVYDPKPRIKIKMPITWGIDADVFDILDSGLNRSSAQILAMAGYPNQTHLAATARLLVLFDEHEYRNWRRVKVTSHQILEAIVRSGIAEYVPICSQLTPIGFIASAATVGYYVCARSYPDGPHEKFIDCLKTGKNYSSEDDPAFTLREYMIRSKNVGRVRRDAFIHLALYIKTWNDFVEGRKRNMISWRTTEGFPKPLEKADEE